MVCFKGNSPARRRRREVEMSARRTGGEMGTRRKIGRRHFVRVAASCPAGLLVGMPAVADGRKKVFADAIAVWHMGDAADRAAPQAGLRIHGNVKLGVPLRGAEREASLNRGGDGKMAEFWRLSVDRPRKRAARSVQEEADDPLPESERPQRQVGYTTVIAGSSGSQVCRHALRGRSQPFPPQL